MEAKNPKEAMDMEKQFERIEKFIMIDTAKQAVASLTNEQKFDFLSDYYFNDSFNYDEAISKRTEESLIMLEKALETNSTPPYAPEIMVAMLNICRTSVIDQMIDTVSNIHKTFRSKIKDLKITDFKSTMIYQLGMGNITMKYNQLLAADIQNECKSRGMNLEEFMKQAMPALTNDFSIFFDFDGYVALKNYESQKDKPIDISTIVAYSKRIIEYTDLLLENKINPESVMVYPSLMNQFLIMEFDISNCQIMAKINEVLKLEDREKNMKFFEQLLEEIWYVERGKGLIYMIFQHQMEMAEKMMSGGLDSSMMNGMNPAMMGGMDPSMLGGMDPAMLGGFDPSMLGGNVPQNLDGMSPMNAPLNMGNPQMPDLAKLQQAMENMDLAQLEEIMPDMKQMMEMMNNQTRK